MYLLPEHQIYECPAEYQQRVTQAGGTNPYGEPNYKIVWSYGTTIKVGGYCLADGFEGYRDVPMYIGEPCWLLLEWQSPEMYGSPAYYYFRNRDEATGLQLLGEYPHRGRYEILFPMLFKEMRGSQLIVEPMPLSNLLLNTIIPTILAAKEVSLEKKYRALQEQKERDELAQLARVEASLSNSRVAFNNAAVSFAGQRHRNTAVDKKYQMLKANLGRAMAATRGLSKGFQVANRNT